MTQNDYNNNAQCPYRGARRQHLGAQIGIFTWWGLGLPLALGLAFWGKMGVVGIWRGLALTVCVQSLVMGYVVVGRLDWEEEAKKAGERNRRSEMRGRERERRAREREGGIARDL